MHSLYNFSLRCYDLVLRMASGFNARAKAWIQGRKGWKEDLLARVQKLRGSEVVWFHCASLGEFEQGRPLIEELRTRYPLYKVIVSFFSPSGYVIRRHYKYADAVVYLPLDTPANAKFWVETVKPKIAFFIKYEYWFNFLMELKSHHIPVVFVSAVFSPEALFFQWYGSWFRSQLENIQWFYVQDENSGEQIQSLGFENVTISGDTRFDRVTSTAASAEAFPLVRKFCGDYKIVMGGSTWPEDEAMMIQLIRAGREKIKFILATHDVSPSRIRSLEGSLEMPSTRYSNLNADNAEQSRILIIDTIGILSQLYQYADIAFIGGAFGSGLHNILEAVVFGVPVFFGPRHGKFWEAAALIKKGGAFEVKHPEEFMDMAIRLLEDTAEYNKTSRICADFIVENCGATKIIMDGSDALLR